MAKQPAIVVPEGCRRVLLHACCAPCSSAIVEWLLAHAIEPVIYYYNPNIYPQAEYEIRKNESKRHAESLGIRWIDGDEGLQVTGYGLQHEAWRHDICGGLEPSKILHAAMEPERGKRCEVCFYHRLLQTARKAQELGIEWFATTLASSRWKNLEQINAAGKAAANDVNGGNGENGENGGNGENGENAIRFWAQNWRKDGLQERRNQLLKEYEFYNQTYCGCEFSMHPADRDDRGSEPIDTGTTRKARETEKPDGEGMEHGFEDQDTLVGSREGI